MNTDKNKTRIEMLFAGVNFDTYFGTIKTEYNDDFSPKSVTLVYDEQQDKNWKNLISTCLQDNVKVAFILNSKKDMERLQKKLLMYMTQTCGKDSATLNVFRNVIPSMGYFLYGHRHGSLQQVTERVLEKFEVGLTIN
jgi:hypothetical protein